MKAPSIIRCHIVRCVILVGNLHFVCRHCAGFPVCKVCIRSKCVILAVAAETCGMFTAEGAVDIERTRGYGDILTEPDFNVSVNCDIRCVINRCDS